MLYGETTPEESFMLSEIIENNNQLKHEVRKMRDTMSSLDMPLFAPSEGVVENILSNSRGKALEFSL